MAQHQSLQLYINYIYDLLISTFYIIFGRVLPTQTVQPRNLTGKNIIITGANSGIGLELSRQLAAMGASVYMACRSPLRGEAALRSIRGTNQNADLHVLQLDTSSTASVRSFAEAWGKAGREVHVLMLNAGVAGAPVGQDFTDDGLEFVYQTNFLSSFLLTHLLERYFSPGARVVLTSSTGQYAGGFSASFALGRTTNVIETGFHLAGSPVREDMYFNSKLMQVAFARGLQERFWKQGTKRSASSYTPGFVRTAIMEKLGEGRTGTIKWVGKVLIATLSLAVMPEAGVKTGLYLALEGDGDGAYWDRMGKRLSNADLMPQETLNRLWIRWCADAEVEWI